MPRYTDRRPFTCIGCGSTHMLNLSVVDKAEPTRDGWDAWWEVFLNDGRHVPSECPSCRVHRSDDVEEREVAF